MKRTQEFLFYLLILLLPTQLGRHFFFHFSLIFGIRSDYLTPTIFLTDILIAVIVGIEVVINLKSQISNLKATTQNSKLRNPYLESRQKTPRRWPNGLLRGGGISNKYLLFTIFYLLFTTIFVAANKWIALYKLVKIIEFILLGFVIVRLKPNFFTTLSVLCFDTVYTSFIAVWQFIRQRSVDGFLWWLGERSFYASTPGIARFSFDGRFFLRPYATFPHPNVMAGFLAVVLPVFLYVLLYNRQHKRFVIPSLGILPTRSAKSALFSSRVMFSLFAIAFLSGLFALFLSYSRAAWLAASIGFITVIFKRWEVFIFFKKHKIFTVMIFYMLFILSVVLPLSFIKIIPRHYQSLEERAELVEGALKMFPISPLLGVGLNNSVIRLHNFISKAPGFYVFQPVHNVYLLVLVETGLFGLVLFVTAIMAIYQAALRGEIAVILILTTIFFLFYFDHYFFTLQQGQLLLTVFASFAFCKTRLVLPGRKS